MGKISNCTAKLLGQNLVSTMENKTDTLESQTALTLSTLLDPRFKAIGFYNQVQAQASIKRLTAQCSQLSDINLWEKLDRDASEARRARNATVDTIVEASSCLDWLVVIDCKACSSEQSSSKVPFLRPVVPQCLHSLWPLLLPTHIFQERYVTYVKRNLSIHPPPSVVGKVLHREAELLDTKPFADDARRRQKGPLLRCQDNATAAIVKSQGYCVVNFSAVLRYKLPVLEEQQRYRFPHQRLVFQSDTDELLVGKGEAFTPKGTDSRPHLTLLLLLSSSLSGETARRIQKDKKEGERRAEVTVSETLSRSSPQIRADSCK
ncbi:hypothetical protein D9C73_020306 [Collichthys lucidus]|uniref:Uncharacterized protein n=1 Tax=Collichthys lucidus TaxID=240159 RepID=A0A4U5VE00_COLLU|nr:hypothetical protein D9C73_020306 [Collichthys lucidus]